MFLFRNATFRRAFLEKYAQMLPATRFLLSLRLIHGLSDRRIFLIALPAMAKKYRYSCPEKTLYPYLCNLMTKEDFLKKTSEGLNACQLYPSEQPVLVGLSGGADSIALVLALRALAFNVEALHCNFELRNAESDRDETFVRSFCRQQDLKLTVVHFQTRSYAARKGISLEMAARELRYEYFERQRGERQAAAIAVAHHRDDNAETLLLNLIRGTGIRGLCGMAPRNGHVVRPFLNMARAEIEAYLAGEGQAFVTDSSNLAADVVRNKIRLNIMPLLQEINPSVVSTLQATAARMSGTEAYYNAAIEEARQRVWQGDGIDVNKLREEPAPQTLLYELLSEKGFNSAQVNEIYEHLSGASGREYLSRDWRLLIDRGRILLRNRHESYACLCDTLPSQGRVKVAPDTCLAIDYRSVSPGFSIPRDKQTVCVDADKLTLPLTVRFIRAGDRFVPFGMKGEKLVSDYLTDCKKSVFAKERQLVVCSGERIVWLVGERADNRFRLESGSRNALLITRTVSRD